MNVQSNLEKLRMGEVPDEKLMRKVILAAQSIMLEEPTLLKLKSPISICGNINGQFYDLLKMFRLHGKLPETQYIFLGGMVNRGFHSLETITYLLLLKIEYPDRIFLLRGNHETRNMGMIFGFYDELRRKYNGRENIYSLFCNLFNSLPLSAVIDDKIFCVHAGLSPDAQTLGSISRIKRNTRISYKSPMSDLLHSNPDPNIQKWGSPSEDWGWIFGSEVVDQFLEINDLSLIVRSHQMVSKGYEYLFEKKNLVKTWTAPNYSYRCGNPGCVFKIDENTEPDPVLFKEEDTSQHQKTKKDQKRKPMYFM